MENRNSFIKKTYIMLIIQVICLLAILASFLLIMYHNARNSLITSADNFLNLYCSDLEDKLEFNETILKELVYDNSQYILLQSEKENIRYYASIDLQHQLLEIIDSNPNSDFVVVAEADYETFLFAQKGNVTEKLRQSVKSFAFECVGHRNLASKWSVVWFCEKPYICKMYVWRGRMAATFLSVDRFLDYDDAPDMDKMQVILTDEQEIICSGIGDVGLCLTAGEEYVPHEKKNLICLNRSLGDGAYHLYLYYKTDHLIGQFSWGAFALLGIIVWSVLFGALLTRTINREVLDPMGKFQANMEYIQQGNYEHRITESYRNAEFETLRSVFNKMMDEIVDLKISHYEKQLELSNSELRSIRFQIRPHFFLNALTTISSLSMQGKNADIVKYIASLSKNVRYMFKSGLHTVTLDEELKHVENYFEMQELKYPGSVFYFISVSEDLRSWRIPQMLIHTIVENEYKYAVSMDMVLSIFISISQADVNGEQMLSIEIEDDGKGYPEDVIESFGSNSFESSDGSRVGLWGLKRMLELMYEREKLFTIENIEPHGTRNVFMIPARPKQEVGVMDRQKMNPLE